MKTFLQNGNLTYVAMMNARPQAVGYGQTDSPAGLAGWMLVWVDVQKGARMLNSSNRVPGAAKPDVERSEIAVLAGGCFWGVEQILREVPGVIDTDVGYTGGWLENPTYHDTHDGESGHAEAVRVTFDPSVMSYEELLEKWFFKLHDPTTLNRQGNDVGTQYRSAIFPQTSSQRSIAERVIARVEASGAWERSVTTSIEEPAIWYSAEDYHQDYLQTNPGGYTCHFLRT